MFQLSSPAQAKIRSLGRSRSGSVLICVVVCITVITMMLGAMLKTTFLTQRRLRAERNLRQTEWLVQAGLERAVFQLSRQPDYRGEVWQLEPDQIVGVDAGQVTIEVSDSPGGGALVRVVAEYPPDSPSSIKRSQLFAVDATKF